MAERILTPPAHLFRRVAMPATFATLGALFVAAIGYLRVRARQPAVPRMSDDWLRTHNRDAGRFDEWRGFNSW